MDKICINFCDRDDLLRVPGIGSANAERILALREATVNITPELLASVPYIRNLNEAIDGFDFTPAGADALVHISPVPQARMRTPTPPIAPYPDDRVPAPGHPRAASLPIRLSDSTVSYDQQGQSLPLDIVGYPRASTYDSSASFGEGTGEILLDNVECTGTESNIAFCRHNGYYNHNCGHHNDVGVVCEGIDNAYLYGWMDENAGLVEVTYQGSWGTVCADGFGLAEANVVCRMTGYTFAESYASCCPYFWEGYGDIHRFNCTGEEVNIGHCSHNPFATDTCGHQDDVGVTCRKLPVRLVGGDTPNEGRVEVQHSEYYYSWGTVCSDSWDINDATVVCRMLGYPGVSSAMKSFGPGSGDIILDNVNCDGSETHLAHCNHAGYLVHNCDHTEDVGVECSGQGDFQLT
nr:deleted in malignant brain tumors 1 protein-like [Lytechinus pictus]